MPSSPGFVLFLWGFLFVCLFFVFLHVCLVRSCLCLCFFIRVLLAVVDVVAVVVQRRFSAPVAFFFLNALGKSRFSSFSALAAVAVSVAGDSCCCRCRRCCCCRRRRCCCCRRRRCCCCYCCCLCFFCVCLFFIVRLFLTAASYNSLAQRAVELVL